MLSSVCYLLTTPHNHTHHYPPDRKALFQYEVNATGVDSKWYFYLDDHWRDAASESDCRQKLEKARFTGMLLLKSTRCFVFRVKWIILW